MEKHPASTPTALLQEDPETMDLALLRLHEQRLKPLALRGPPYTHTYICIYKYTKYLHIPMYMSMDMHQ